jgi:inosine-uridine nucleoside N-ribohydrolase
MVYDTDMGMDDLLALYMILRDPALDVRAIAIDGTGLIHCGAGIRNMRRILGAFDRLDIPFGCGRTEAGSNGRSFPDEWRATSDDMYGAILPPVAASEFPLDAVTILHDALAASPEPVTVLAVGTWTNLQDLFAAHPDDLDKVAGIHTMAGTIDDPGNIELGGTTPADKVEWNVGADPEAFAAVMALDVPVTLVPLDATNDVPTPPDIVQLLEGDHAAAGADIAFETYLRNPYLAEQGNYWWDATAAAALTDPGLLRWEDMNVSVTTEGPGAGRISRDAAGRPVRAAMGADGDRVRAAVLAGLRRGAPRAESFTPVGTIDATWDGTTCRVEGMPAKSGLVLIDFHNRSSTPASFSGAGVREPKTWADALEYIDALDLSLEPVIPDWLVPLKGSGGFAEAGEDGTGLATLPTGLVGLACAYGDWPNVEFVDGGSHRLAE